MQTARGAKQVAVACFVQRPAKPSRRVEDGSCRAKRARSSKQAIDDSREGKSETVGRGGEGAEYWVMDRFMRDGLKEQSQKGLAALARTGDVSEGIQRIVRGDTKLRAPDVPRVRCWPTYLDNSVVARPGSCLGRCLKRLHALVLGTYADPQHLRCIRDI